MADRIQQRRDTAANWAKYNPILLEGEVGYVLDNPNQYKIGDGVHAWNDLPLRGFDGTLVHELGNSETAAMSQKAITDLFNAGYLFAGIATPDTNPGTPDQNVFYIAAEPGTYAYFSNVSISTTGLFLLVNKSGSWTLQSIDIFKYLTSCAADSMQGVLIAKSNTEYILSACPFIVNHGDIITLDIWTDESLECQRAIAICGTGPGSESIIFGKTEYLGSMDLKNHKAFSFSAVKSLGDYDFVKNNFAYLRFKVVFTTQHVAKINYQLKVNRAVIKTSINNVISGHIRSNTYTKMKAVSPYITFSVKQYEHYKLKFKVDESSDLSKLKRFGIDIARKDTFDKLFDTIWITDNFEILKNENEYSVIINSDCEQAILRIVQDVDDSTSANDEIYPIVYFEIEKIEQKKISDAEVIINEIMAHKNMPAYHKGVVYDVYMCDETQELEYVPAKNTIKIRLSMRSIADMTKQYAVDVYERYGLYGSTKITNRSPQNPTCVISLSGNYCCVFGTIRKSDNKEIMGMRQFHTVYKKYTVDNICTLNGEIFSFAKMVSLYNELLSTSIPTIENDNKNHGMNGSGNIIKSSDGTYYWAIGGEINHFGGVIVSSSDLINWLFVSAYDITKVANIAMVDISIAEIETGILTLAYHAYDYDGGGKEGNYLATYNINTKEWTAPFRFNDARGDSGSRPFFFKLNNQWYLLANTQSTGPGRRTNVGLYKMTSSTEFECMGIKNVPRGFQYPTVAVTEDNKAYLYYSSDSKHISLSNGYSNIVCEEFKFEDFTE